MEFTQSSLVHLKGTERTRRTQYECVWNFQTFQHACSAIQKRGSSAIKPIKTSYSVLKCSECLYVSMLVFHGSFARHKYHSCAAWRTDLSGRHRLGPRQRMYRNVIHSSKAHLASMGKEWHVKRRVETVGTLTNPRGALTVICRETCCPHCP